MYTLELPIYNMDDFFFEYPFQPIVEEKVAYFILIQFFVVRRTDI